MARYRVVKAQYVPSHLPLGGGVRACPDTSGWSRKKRERHAQWMARMAYRLAIQAGEAERQAAVAAEAAYRSHGGRELLAEVAG